MNPLIKVLSGIIIIINRIIDGINPSTAQSIKQGFIFLIVAMSIAGILIGRGMGTKAAKQGGISLAEKTDTIFDIDLKKNRADGSFRPMLESDLIDEMKQPESRKEAFPANQSPSIESDDHVIEPNHDRKAPSRVQEESRDRVAEIPREDDTIREPSVKEVRRTGLRNNASSASAEHETIQMPSRTSGDLDDETAAPSQAAVPTKTQTPKMHGEKERKPMPKQKKALAPVQKDFRTAE